MSFTRIRSISAAAVCALGLFSGAAQAGLLGTTVGLHVYSTFQDDNGVQTRDFGTISVVVGAGAEFTESFSIQLTQGGFSTASNVYSGRLGVDISDNAISVSYAGQAQPGAIYFDFTGITPSIASLALTETGGLSGTNYFLPPTNTASTVTGMGFGLLGFQPGTSMTQTAALTFDSNTGGGTVPEPATLALLGVALAGAAWSRRRSAA